MEKEDWRWIKGYEGRYEVSSAGRIRSWVSSQLKRLPEPKYIGIYLDNCGYRRASLYKGNVNRRVHVHREVAKAFIPNDDGLEIVNHINGIKSDNRRQNLEWVSRADNNRHAYRMGLTKLPDPKRGEECRLARLRNADVVEIRRIYAEGNITQAEVGKLFGVQQTTVYKIVNRITWAHV